MSVLTDSLERAARRLAAHLHDLEPRLEGDPTAWGEYIATVTALGTALEHVAPGKRGELLTTLEMARRLSLSPKTLLRRKARGEIRPALQRGKLIRWRGDEVAR